MKALKKFQDLLLKRNINAYIVPSSDFHSSEYLSDYFKARAFLSKFTGSAGTLVVTQKSAYLWTDGRYFIQAALELDNNHIQLMKMGHPNVLTITEFLNQELNDGDTLAFDGRLLSTSFVLDLINKIQAKIQISADKDLINYVWNKRPNLPFSILYRHDEFFSGKSYQAKLAEVREIMKNENTNVHILTSLEDQAWLFNLRANDIAHTPVFLAYTVITNESVQLFINQNKIDLSIDKYLSDNDVILKGYNEIYDYLKTVKNKNILIDFNKANYQIYDLIKSVNTLINKPNPTLGLKCIKNETEIKNTRLAHIKDGAAFTKFMYYLKNAYDNNEEISEISVSDYLEDLRSKNKGYIDLSFNTICAFKEHAAMMHYSAKPDSEYKLDDNGFLLIDSGAHYLEGTTDITRTIALGTITDEMKLHFTTVLKSVIALSTAVFLKGCRGSNLDVLARGPIWKLLIDYKCGTGHGVGHVLSVHEAPNGFRWNVVPERNDSAVLLPGMITTNEPGIYLENKYGIRIENEMLCVEKASNEFGEFLAFETLTFAPIDLDCIDADLLTNDEKEWLNNYHQEVYDNLHDYLTDEELDWLRAYTRKI